MLKLSAIIFVSISALAFQDHFLEIGERPESLTFSVPYIPQAVIVDGVVQLVYEIHITNVSFDSLCIKQITILDVHVSRVLTTLKGDNLRARISQHSSSGVLAEGKSAIVYIEVDIHGNELPRRLVNRIYFVRCKNGSATVESMDIPCDVSGSEATALSAPLKGGPWAAVYDPTWERGHRRVIYSVDNIKRIPGRFAIDFIKLDDSGRYADGNEDLIANWYGYGSEVLAVADGEVSSVRDDFPESPSVSRHPRYDSARAAGNFISLKIEDGKYVFYEHLKPKSIIVKKGDRVTRGMVIAKLGFTGQTTGPHLHLHVADSDSPLGAEGLPFKFSNYNLLGRYTDFSKFGKEQWEVNPPKLITTERPASNSVIRFQ